MGFFYSPMKLMELFKEKETVAVQLKENGADWFFSPEGEKAYQDARTPAQKTMYFFQYLLTVCKQDNRDVLYKIAYIMANSMDQSSLAFAGYPDILNANKNPLVWYVKTNDLDLNELPSYGVMLLAALHDEEDARKFLVEKQKPYSNITYCDADGTVSDMYRIERDIIGVFCADFPGPYMPPYRYDIIDSSEGDEDEENKEGA